MSTDYKELYAVPKESFDKYIRYRMGNFPNVRNLKVQQLNFNEAKKLNTYQQHNTPTQQGFKQLNVSSKYDKPPDLLPFNLGQNYASTSSANPNTNPNLGQRLGDGPNLSSAGAQEQNNNSNNANQFSTNSANQSSNEANNASGMNMTNNSEQDETLQRENEERLNDLRENAVWNPNIVKQSQSAVPTPPPRRTSLLNQTAVPFNQFKESVNQYNSNADYSQPNPNFQISRDSNNTFNSEEENIFHTGASNTPGRARNRTPKTSTPDNALKLLEKSLQKVPANPRPGKNFLAANKSAVANQSVINQSIKNQTKQKAPPKKSKNPRKPNLNNSKPVATNTRAKKLSAAEGVARTASFNKSAVEQEPNIKEKTEKLQRAAMRR